MPLPAAWVESLFARLQARYGSAWLRIWEGTDIAAVKADWADELAGFADHPEAISHALQHLPADRPPTVGQFMQLCIRRPDPLLPALPAPVASPEVVAAVKKAFGPKSDGDPKAWAWAWRLKAREESGERIPVAHRTMWRAALKAEMSGIAQSQTDAVIDDDARWRGEVETARAVAEYEGRA